MELKTASNPIDSAGTTKQVLSNLFYGWGYNFYRKENQLRADDLLIRSKGSEMLGAARAHLGELEAQWRREKLPPPSREHPFPDHAAIATAQALQVTGKNIEALEVQLRNAGVPEMDRIHQRHRNEHDTLEHLSELDLRLIGAIKSATAAIATLSDPATAAAGAEAALKAGAIDTAIAARQAELSALA